MLKEDVKPWSVVDSSELYEVRGWGKGYFSIAPSGHLLVHPTKNPDHAIDLKKLVDQLQLRGIELPILIRFAELLNHRIGEIYSAFDQAIAEHAYPGKYTCVYPIKVNQQRPVVEEVVEFGEVHAFGLEAGSKPELLAVMAVSSNNTPIVCNGFKDAEYIRLTMLAHKIGRNITPVIEKFTELEMILRYARELDVRPRIGVRVKLSSQGSGRWKSSGGHRSKFGLTVTEVMRVVEELRRHDMQDCLKMLHFHLGSQITNIRIIKSALDEAAQIYCGLVQAGADLDTLDVGGGLGVDYDGSQTNFESSVNYTLQEYANDVIYHVQNACHGAGVPCPNIVSESGRAVVAYHSVLVFGVLGVTGLGESETPANIDEQSPQPVKDLLNTYQSLCHRNALESYHDAQQLQEMAMNLFRAGHLSLEQRCQAENLFWGIAREILRLTKDMEFVPEELQGLEAQLSETYFCNFSLFQSIPDSWAIKQLFPVMPIHRLDERPTSRAVVGDITCDSDGKIDQFIDRRDVKRVLPLHTFKNEPYYLGAFLVGAYQEILGDMHNLFGDTNAVHVSIDETGEVELQHVIKGDTVRDVLKYVQFDSEELVKQLRKAVEVAVREGRIELEQSGQLLRDYTAGLEGYTYLTGGPE